MADPVAISLHKPKVGMLEKLKSVMLIRQYNTGNQSK